MTARNVNLPDHLMAFVDEQVRKERHGSSDEVFQEAMDRYSREVSAEADLMARIDAAADEGMRAIDEGRYVVLNSPAETNSFIDSISERVAQKYAGGHKLG